MQCFGEKIGEVVGSSSASAESGSRGLLQRRDAESTAVVVNCQTTGMTSGSPRARRLSPRRHIERSG